jgi:hypothetical protein
MSKNNLCRNPGVGAQSLAGQLEEAFNGIGTSMMSDEFAARLLAYLYVMGGGNESVVLHGALNAGIRIAQEKFKLKGGQRPDGAGITLIQKYVAELESSYAFETGYQAEWLDEIGERYGLHIRRHLSGNIRGRRRYSKK